jgi:hypothetical protein
MKSENIDKIMIEIKRNLKRKPRKRKTIRHISRNFLIGMYIGEIIVLRYLPTLSTDIFKSRKVIKVSDEDATRHRIVYNAWYATESQEGYSEAWETLKSLEKELILKYLPERLKCYVIDIPSSGLEEIKSGIIDSLWNSDICNYSCNREDIHINVKESKVTLKLQL